MECQSHLGWQWVCKQLQWIFCQENKPVFGNKAAYDSYWSGRLRSYGTLQTLLCSMITWSYLLSFWLKGPVTSYRESKCLLSLMWDNRSILYLLATLAMHMLPVRVLLNGRYVCLHQHYKSKGRRRKKEVETWSHYTVSFPNSKIRLEDKNSLSESFFPSWRWNA